VGSESRSPFAARARTRALRLGERQQPFRFDPAQLLADLSSRFRLRHCTHVGRGVRVLGDIWLPGQGEVWLGDGVVLDAREAPIEFKAWAGSTLKIGNDTYIGGGTSIELRRSVVIGARVRVGSYCKILDSHLHHFAGSHQEPPPSTPTVVEDDVVIGARSILLAGAHVGARATLDPGTVVKRRIEAGAVAGGVPARVRARP
jgi:serine acetyltransferase